MRTLLSQKLADHLRRPGSVQTPASAAALAEKILRENAPVVTIECYDKTAKVAQQIFDKCDECVTFGVPGSQKDGSLEVQLNVGKAIDLRVGKADDVMRTLSVAD